MAGYVSAKGWLLYGGGCLMLESHVATRSRPAARAAWRRASFCQSGECVEVARQGPLVALRNSKNPGLVLRYTATTWLSFVSGIKAGEFDDLPRCRSTA
jgi:Domain of unknown function (DUF397)